MPTPAALFGLILFGIVGFAAFRYGMKSAQWKPVFIGVALMAYPYFVSETWVLYAIGCALCGVLYWFRD